MLLRSQCCNTEEKKTNPLTRYLNVEWHFLNISLYRFFRSTLHYFIAFTIYIYRQLTKMWLLIEINRLIQNCSIQYKEHFSTFIHIRTPNGEREKRFANAHEKNKNFQWDDYSRWHTLYSKTVWEICLFDYLCTSLCN